MNAYRETLSGDGRTTTRTYADGRRTIIGPNFQSTGKINGTQFVHYQNGLHAAYLPNGRAVYAERYIQVHGVDSFGAPALVPGVQRTVYSISRGGIFVPLATPIERVYAVETFGGYPTFVYRPVIFPAAFFGVLYAPFAFPVVLGPNCLLCPAGTVAFLGAPQPYTDPVAVLGDEQIADAVADGGLPAETAIPQAPAADPTAAPPADALPPSDAAPGTPGDSSAVPPPPAPPPEVNGTQAQNEVEALRSEAKELSGQLTARAQRDTQTADASSKDGSLAMLHPVAFTTTTPDAQNTTDPIPVPEDVRDQMRKQVRLSIAEHANDRALTLTDVVHSGYARIFLFQVASSIDTVSAVAGDHCELGSGDLLSLTEQGVQEGRPTAQMKVVFARPGHCLTQDTVEVSLSDLQEMLNTFNERLESNIRKLDSCVAAKGACLQSS